MAQFLAGVYPDFANHVTALPNGSLWQAVPPFTSNHAVALRLFSVSLSASACYRPEAKIAQPCRRIARLDKVSCVARQLADTIRICSRPLREVALYAPDLALCCFFSLQPRSSHCEQHFSSVIFFVLCSSCPPFCIFGNVEGECFVYVAGIVRSTENSALFGGLIRPHPHIAVITLSVGIV